MRTSVQQLSWLVDELSKLGEAEEAIFTMGTNALILHIVMIHFIFFSDMVSWNFNKFMLYGEINK